MTRLLLSCVICLIVMSFRPVDGNFNHSVGPLAICKPTMEDARAYAENCYKMCTRDTEPSSHGYLSLYTESSKSGGPIVTRCNKVRLEQEFTETWTLSTVKGLLRRVMIGITESECRDAIKENCPTNNCSLKAPSSIPEEYHYASDTLVTQEHIELLSVPSGIDYLSNHMRLTPALTGESYPVSDGVARSGMFVLIWDPKYDEPECPFTVAKTLGCDMYDKPKDLINCRRARFVIPEVSESSPLQSKCHDLLKSKSGLIYKWEDKGSDTRRETKRVAISPISNSDEHLASLRVQVTDAIEVLGEDLCQTQCELLDLQLRNDRKREVLTRIGGSYMVISKTGYLRKCHPTVGCRLIKPHLFCGNPNRVAVSCQGLVYMWNPQKSYLEDGTDCEKHQSNSKLIFTVGSHDYSIEDDLHAELPDKDHFGVAHDLIALATDNINTEIVDPGELRKSWMSHVDHEAQVSSDPITTNVNISTWEPDFPFHIEGVFSAAGRIISDFSSRVTLLITVILTLVALVIGAKAWSLLNHRNSRRKYIHQSVPLVEPQASWI
ncbi:TPA_asm: G [Primula alphacytorhabdovirus 1]|nr:TPA_asm: G [Primula alphacytorhabdovirus 1]